MKTAYTGNVQIIYKSDLSQNHMEQKIVLSYISTQ
jgi:hypothetical protein